MIIINMHCIFACAYSLFDTHDVVGDILALFIPQVIINLFCFFLGFAVDGAVSVIGVIAMDTVPDNKAGLAHGIACAWAQGSLTINLIVGGGHVLLFIYVFLSNCAYMCV